MMTIIMTGDVTDLEAEVHDTGLILQVQQEVQEGPEAEVDHPEKNAKGTHVQEAPHMKRKIGDKEVSQEALLNRTEMMMNKSLLLFVLFVQVILFIHL